MSGSSPYTFEECAVTVHQLNIHRALKTSCWSFRNCILPYRWHSNLAIILKKVANRFSLGRVPSFKADFRLAIHRESWIPLPLGQGSQLWDCWHLEPSNSLPRSCPVPCGVQPHPWPPLTRSTLPARGIVKHVSAFPACFSGADHPWLGTSALGLVHAS